MSNFFCVNKSGKKLPVRATSSRTGTIIGYINPREAFAVDWEQGGDGVFNQILFLSSSGTLKIGHLIDPPDHGMDFVTTYPYSTTSISGNKYPVMILRKDCKVYKPNGSLWKTIPAGRKVVCKDSTTGDTHLDWKKIHYYQNDAGVYASVCDSIGYGYLDTGLSKGSGYSKIAMYGSW